MTAESARTAALDPHTGLPHRDGFAAEVTAALAAERLLGGRVTLLVLEIDRYAALADGIGPAAAEDVVLRAAERLRAALPREDVLGRIGRHRFGVLLGDRTEAQTADRPGSGTAQRIFAAMEPPFAVAGHEVPVDLSIGIAVEAAGMDTADTLVHAADEALRAAQRGGRAGCATFDHVLRARAAAQAGLELELRAALRHQRIGIVARPVLGLGRSTGQDRVTAAEVQPCWTRPDGTDVPAHRFTALAADLGLGVTLALQVIDEALCALTRWQHEGSPVEQVWVQLGGSELDDPEFAHMVSARLAARGIPPTALLVAVGPAVPVESEQAVSTLGMLRSLGVAVALSDFGRTGTSLTALRQLPITTVMLDRRLAGDLSRTATVPHAVAELCRALGLRVAVDGVETTMQVEGARAIGADAVLGAAVAGPVSPAALTGLVAGPRRLASLGGPSAWDTGR